MVVPQQDLALWVPPKSITNACVTISSCPPTPQAYGRQLQVEHHRRGSRHASPGTVGILLLGLDTLTGARSSLGNGFAPRYLTSHIYQDNIDEEGSNTCLGEKCFRLTLVIGCGLNFLACLACGWLWRRDGQRGGLS